MKKLVISGEKGGIGKSTLVALLIEYLEYQNKKVKLIDTDPSQTSQQFIKNCQEDGRNNTVEFNPEYVIIDTAGNIGAGLIEISNTNVIVLPFRPHYPDCRMIWKTFESLDQNARKKVIFVPNFWQNTNEQKEGIKMIEELIAKYQAGIISKPINNMPAFYGTILNGNANNFFKTHKEKECQKIKEILELITKYET